MLSAGADVPETRRTPRHTGRGPGRGTHEQRGAGLHEHRERLRPAWPSGRSRRTRRALRTHRSTGLARLSADGGDGRRPRHSFIARGLTDQRRPGTRDGNGQNLESESYRLRFLRHDVNPSADGGCRVPCRPAPPTQTNSVRCPRPPSPHPRSDPCTCHGSINITVAAERRRRSSPRAAPILHSHEPVNRESPRPHGFLPLSLGAKPDLNRARLRPGDLGAVARVPPDSRSVHRLSRTGFAESCICTAVSVGGPWSTSK
jgi:hypothetical protein